MLSAPVTRSQYSVSRDPSRWKIHGITRHNHVPRGHPWQQGFNRAGPYQFSRRCVDGYLRRGTNAAMNRRGVMASSGWLPANNVPVGQPRPEGGPPLLNGRRRNLRNWGGWIRTTNLPVNSRALCQLSYTPIEWLPRTYRLAAVPPSTIQVLRRNTT